MGIQDKNLISILGRLLKAEIKGEGIPTKGTPQGGIISPLLANVVLNELDWWISDQWETFKTDHRYKYRYIKYKSLRRASELKEIYIVRYADDFKILCRNYETASKIKIAVSKWLKERLNLEVSKKKTKITNLKTSYSKFLGIKFKVKRKGQKYVCKSRICKDTRSKLAYKLKQQIKEIQEQTTVKQVSKLNSMILGMHQYYSMATHVNIDFHEIAFLVNRTLENRLREKMSFSEKGDKSRAYEKFYGGYNYKPYSIAGIRIFPIAGVRTSPPLNFKQDICDYTKKGRKKIHEKLKSVDPNVLRYIMENPVKGETIEYNDNRIARYSGQGGTCYITGKPLTIGDIECHHKKPRNDGGGDNYNNLILVTYNIHKLIHAKKQETIEKYLDKVEKLYLDEKTLSKLNKFRSKVGNDYIELT
jgi:5-methylcytosine-specific restriction endonuclease McrA